MDAAAAPWKHADQNESIRFSRGLRGDALRFWRPDSTIHCTHCSLAWPRRDSKYFGKRTT